MKIIITRLIEKGEKDREICQKYGWESQSAHPLSTQLNQKEIESCINAINQGKFDALFFTSAYPAKIIAPYLDKNIVQKMRFIAIGPETRRVLLENNISAEMLPEHNSDSLTSYLKSWIIGKNIGIPRVNIPNTRLTSLIEQAGGKAYEYHVYELIPSEENINVKGADAILFTSASSFTKANLPDITRLKILAIGNKTAEAMTKKGVIPDIIGDGTLEGTLKLLNQKRSDDMNPDIWNKEDVALTLATFNHSTYNQESLASIRFKEDEFYISEPFAGAVLLQTCNRVEILIHGTKEELQEYLLKQGRSNADILENNEVLIHLSRLASGMESMIVGEDQILGQLKTALITAEKYHADDEIVSTCITTAIQLGARIRQETAINRGAVSIGSAAVQLAEKICSTLDNKNILVVGGGEVGTLVTKSLSEKNLRAIYVTNRTYENAVKLAEEVHGRAMHMDQLETCISLSDVVISCTAAPHYIIKRDMMEGIMEARFWPLDTEPRPLVLIDIAQPCDIEKSCSELPGVRLFTIDDLKGISEQNLLARRKECVHAEEIIDKFQPKFLKILRRLSGRESLQELYSWAENIRTREVEHAKHLLSSGKDPEEIIQNLTKSLTKKLMEDASANIRKKVEEQKYEEAENLVNTIIGKKNETRSISKRNL